MTRIIIEAVPPDRMRLDAYKTGGCGDWFVDRENGDVHIKVAFDTDVWDDPEAFTIALHELVEARLAFAHGVTEGAVDAFDKLFEEERAVGKHEPGDEPGDDPRAPYGREHAEAMVIELLMRHYLGMTRCAF